MPPTPVHLDPVTSEAYKAPTAPETFQQQRLRLDKQETLSFGPQRARHHVERTPYDKPAAESSEIVFEVQDLDSDSLPKGWTFNKNNHTFELKHKLADFWEITGGCLIRHHVRPRSKKFVPSDIADLPIPLENLDDVRVTVFREPGCDSSSVTDHFKTENMFCARTPRRRPRDVLPNGSDALSISSMLKWHGWSADVATAFLQGMPQTRQLWLRLPNDCLQILGCGPETRAALIKPVYGQLDAPRRWWQEATRRLTGELDPCLFALHHTLEDGTTVPCGLIALRVDDMLGAGDRSCPTYVAAERRLKEVFDFRSWQEDSETMEYCGVLHDRKDFCWTLSQRHFLQKVKPVTIHRGRSQEDLMTEPDRAQLRALLGSLQWPSVQSQPHLQASCSLISGQQRSGKLKAIMEANALLKFAKEHADVSLKYEPFQSIHSYSDLTKLRLVIMFDASHAAREDHSSQVDTWRSWCRRKPSKRRLHTMW